MSDYIGALAEQTGFSAASGLIGGTLGEIFGGLDDRRQVSQQHRLTDIQLDAQKNMMDYGYQKQMDMWNATNYPAQMQQLEKAGLNPGLMYAKGGPGGVTGTPSGSVTGGTAQQNPGEIVQAMGIANQNTLLESQRKLVEAQARETNVRADKESGVDTQLGQTQIASLTQGIQNQKAQQALTQAQTDLTGAAKALTQAQTGLAGAQTGLVTTQGKLAAGTLDKAIEKFGADTQTSIANAKLAMNEAKISDQTIQAKITILKQQAIGEGLENILRATDNTLKQTQIDAIKQSVQNMISLRQLQWTKEERNALHGVLNQNGVNDDGIGQAIEHIIGTIINLF